ncbi:type IV toxin-antitoxin system AbiEi family antitoxin domain-containing protein [Caballeronia sordidicola]|nr:type IV toxin-antitoxin system AbiEi family antitoxin domain-containing protein [Caballeronia sordidicola]
MEILLAERAVQLLMHETPRGQPLDPALLRRLGISPAQTHYLVSAGWLQRLSKGAYLLRGDSLTTDGILVYLTRHNAGLHVGGKTAFDWQGVRHNIAFRPRITLWGVRAYRFPLWVEQHMPYRYQTTRLFDDQFSLSECLKPLPLKNPSVLVSIPELALLELASDIGKRGKKGQSLEEARHLADSMRNLRADRLSELLQHCTRVKVVKLVRDLGESSGYEWGRDLQGNVDRLSAGKRWSSLGENGRRLTLKP